MNSFDIHLKNILNNDNNRYFNDLELKNNEIEKLKSYANLNFASKHSYILNLIKFYNENKNIKILDFGCGGGVPLVLIKMAGYENIFGVDLKELNENKITKQNKFVNLFNFSNKTFTFIENGKTIFDNESFDLIISLQVLEHVKNFDEYYNELHRLIKADGKLILIFPHRLKPYDSHSKTYFIHYFPKKIRGFLYNLFTKDKKEYYENLLNLKSPFFHVKKLNHYFKNVKNIRSINMIYNNHYSYDGNIYLKKIINILIKLLPKHINKFLSIFYLILF